MQCFILATRAAPFALLALSACATGGTYVPPTVSDLQLTNAYQTPQGPADVTDLDTWWAGFNDPNLTSLVTLSLEQNLDIAQAQARIAQARASLDQSRASFWPSVQASVGATESRTSTTASLDSYSANLSASWTIDLFGETRSDVAASRRTLEASVYAWADVRLAIAAEVARNYIDFRAFEQRLTIARETLARQDDNLAIATFRNQAGLVSALDVEQARTQREATAATLPNLERSAASARFRLAVLAGVVPGGVDGFLLHTDEREAIPSLPEAGLPADLLRRRPDVMAAERRYAAAVARIGVARAQLYPSLSLSGTIQTTGVTLESLGDNWASNLAANLTQPLFQGGRLSAIVRQREAAAEESQIAYRAAVLSAVEEVENALASRRAAAERLVGQRLQAEAASALVILALSNYESGLSDFTTLLDAERSLLSAQDSVAASEADLSKAIVQLYLALGGGWTAPAPVTGNAP